MTSSWFRNRLSGHPPIPATIGLISCPKRSVVRGRSTWHETTLEVSTLHFHKLFDFPPTTLYKIYTVCPHANFGYFFRPPFSLDDIYGSSLGRERERERAVHVFQRALSKKWDSSGEICIALLSVHKMEHDARRRQPLFSLWSILFLGKAGKDAKTLVRRTRFRTKLGRFLVRKDTLLNITMRHYILVGWLVRMARQDALCSVLMRSELAFAKNFIELQVQSFKIKRLKVIRGD